MVDLALIFGIFGYCLFVLGLLGILNRFWVLLITLAFSIFLIYWTKKNWKKGYLNYFFTQIIKDKISIIVLALLIYQIFLNFLGALSPELSFDALWYHLTPAKLFAENQRIFNFSGWLLWPINFNKLIDIYYSGLLLFFNEVGPKLLHWIFGILAVASLFNLLRRYLSFRYSLLGVYSFYTMAIVGWLSTTAYVDLGRLFFEILSFDLFLQWQENKKKELLIESSLLMGLAIGSKIIAGSSFLAVLILLIFFVRKKIGLIFYYAIPALLTVLPGFLQMIFSSNPQNPLEKINIWESLKLIDKIVDLPLFLWNTTLKPDNFISPVYLIFAPLVIVYYSKFNLSLKTALNLIILSLIFTPLTSNRYLLSYLALLTLIVFFIIENFVSNKYRYPLIFLLIISGLLNIGSRTIASAKFIPYLFLSQTKAEFLSSRLNFQYGDFYDIDGWFKKNIRKDDLVLIYGIHNLYYVDFPYVHESWVKSGTYFNYILVGNNQKLPEKFGERLLLYNNLTSQVKLYLYGENYP